MAKTIDEGFREFHGTLTPKRGESQAVKCHRTSIKACLEKNFKVTRFFPTGSFENGTSIRGYSDADYFACIPTKNLKEHSVTTLQEVREVLIKSFPNADISIKIPTVKVCFGTNASESIEIVPAGFIQKDKNGNDIYKIANSDGAGGWMRASPDVHNKYVDKINKRLECKVEPLVRLLKAWKYYHSVPVRSFYLEMYAAKYASRQGFIDYSYDLKCIFQSLWDRRLGALSDPTGISGSILPCSSPEQKIDALKKLEAAFKRAQKAQGAEDSEKIIDAFNEWKLVFGKKFPSYG